MSASENLLLTQPFGKLLLRTALLVVLVMAMNGLFQVMDAAFLGHYLGAEALAAVTVMFPLIMLLIALSTLVGSRMASVLARRLGAGEISQARDVFVGAHWLSFVVSGVVMLGFAAGGSAAVHALANDSPSMTEMGSNYANTTVAFLPITLVLSIHGDALRWEDRFRSMAVLAIGSSMLNIGFNFVLIGFLGIGVVGSALGTGLAQAVAAVAVSVYRLRSGSLLAWGFVRGRWRRAATTSWREMLALGPPQSLSFVGISLTSGLVIFSIQNQLVANSPHYEATVGAYGIFTRVMTFFFLPLLGVKLAGQTLLGNNAGAGQMLRVQGALRLLVTTALLYCAVAQTALWFFREHLASWFEDALAVAGELARIVPLATVSYFAVGPLLMLAGYFQAVGDTERAALLGGSRTYFFGLPLLLLLPQWVGEVGMWLALPTADACATLFSRSPSFNNATTLIARIPMLPEKLEPPIYFAFEGDVLLRRGDLREVTVEMLRAQARGCSKRISLFEETTGTPLDIDLSGNEAETMERLALRFADAMPGVFGRVVPSTVFPPKRRGRPKLGVVSREISLLPRHWEWLGAQRGGASSVLRRLVDQARKANRSGLAAHTIDAAHKFMWDIAGNQPGFEEASRALFAQDWPRLGQQTKEWPPDIRAQLKRYVPDL